MLKSENGRILSGMFKSALTELVQCYAGPPIEIEEELCDDADASMTAIVGLCGEQLCASVSLLMSDRSAFELSNSETASMDDWLGELSNQLAGRLKNKINAFGVQLCLSTPTTVRGKFIQLSSTAEESYGITVKYPGGSAIAQMTVNVQPELNLQSETIEEVSVEGSLQLF